MTIQIKLKLEENLFYVTIIALINKIVLLIKKSNTIIFIISLSSIFFHKSINSI